MKGNIYINGQIGTYKTEKGIELIDIIAQVQKQPLATTFNIHINSEGGVFDTGMDIYNYLKSLGRPLTTIGTGMVASVATVVFMAGQKRIVQPGTRFMIHLPWMGAEGNAEDLQAAADVLKKYEKKMLAFYTTSLGIKQEAILPLLRQQTWLTPDNLTTLGFINAEPASIPVMAKAVINLNNDKMSGFTERDKNWLENLFNRVLGKMRSPVLNKVMQDATGAELDFEELADDEPVTKGATATVDGEPAEGEYTMPDGGVYVFAAGVLKEIKPAEEDDDTAAVALRTENRKLKKQLAEVQARLDEVKGGATTQVAAMRREVEQLKRQIMSKFSMDDRKPGKRNDNPADRTAGLREWKNEQRKKR